ncbi:MAG: sensor histidine kinase [Polyangiaceae bacterium]
MIRGGWQGWSRRLGVLGCLTLIWALGHWLPPKLSVCGLVLGGIVALYWVERLRALDLKRAREAERQRLAADLHDGVATSLASLSWGLSGLRCAVQRGEASEERAVRLERDVKELARDLRGVVLELREPPRLLAEWSRDLGTRLQELAQAEADARGVPSQACRVHFSPTGALEQNLAGGLCSELERIVVEGVYNALRHAHCQNIYVVIRAQETIEIEVRDDGFGILGVTRDALPSTGGGLTNLRQRVEALRGQLSVLTGNRGTSVRLRVPLAA